MELVENLISAVKMEPEASRLDADSIRCAYMKFYIASKQSNEAVVES